MVDVAGSSATKRKQPKQIVKSPIEIVSFTLNLLEYFVINVTSCDCSFSPVGIRVISNNSAVYPHLTRNLLCFSRP
jgi:hypothetical protein